MFKQITQLSRYKNISCLNNIYKLNSSSSNSRTQPFNYYYTTKTIKTSTTTTVSTQNEHDIDYNSDDNTLKDTKGNDINNSGLNKTIQSIGNVGITKKSSKIRPHVNPFSPVLQMKVHIPDWKYKYQDLSLPFHIDLGCGRGEMLIDRSFSLQDRNYLGVDIRAAFVEVAQADLDQRREKTFDSEKIKKNIDFLTSHVNVNFSHLAQSLPPNSIKEISILFPDPWWKKRHVKRRMLNSQLIQDIINSTPIGCKIYLMTDVASLLVDMDALFESFPNKFKKLDKDIKWPLPSTRAQNYFQTVNYSIFERI
ncbi:hypothetical protein CYY_000559 [Polysphondylium violaceum]|uniref:tRNA (guanine(46)-N(7))-methyltransferase n=1 Tax=Polysphondylium violaceum TaxID=133409 RepID=A0A8J4Q3P8_9MYCE|nr:hypothetical protein CYY_000559 [Polysphondylium violaceum]